MHFYRAKLGIAKASCLSVCNVEVSWSYKLEFCENNFTAEISLAFSLSTDPNMTDVLKRKHPQILAGIGVQYGKMSIFDLKPSYL